MAKTGMKIFLGIALALILFGLFNLGVYTFYDSPEYNDYCGDVKQVTPDMRDLTEQECIDEGGIYNNGYCDFYEECRGEYDTARDDYNNIIFYIFAVSGLVLALLGIFIPLLAFQIVGIGTGTGLILEGILRNLNNNL